MFVKMPRTEYRRKRNAIVITSNCKAKPMLSLEPTASDKEIKEFTIKRTERTEIDRNVTIDENDVAASGDDFLLLGVAEAGNCDDENDDGFCLRDSAAAMSDSHAPIRIKAPPATT